jgi:hypothetical protein
MLLSTPIVFPGKVGSDAAAWSARAAELAAWAQERLVNRTDAWGAYHAGGQVTVKGQLTAAVLLAHFRARDRSAVIGLHTAAADNLSRGGALDIDHHGPTSNAPDVNLGAALCWFGALARQGFHPLLTDSNGRGGFHLCILLAGPVPGDRLFHLLRHLTRDHRRLGLATAPEQFPKQPDVRRCAKGFGNWLRAPGRHHSRDHWSRVWDGGRWLAGSDAVEFILSLGGDPPSLVPDLPPPAAPAAPRPPHITLRPGYHAGRIAAFMRRLPHLAEGQGRDDIAFRFAAYLVRDLALPDLVALEWLAVWDAGNSPPKGRDRLSEILENAHRYGRNPVGCGLRPGRIITEF